MINNNNNNNNNNDNNNSSTAILYVSREKGGRGLRSIKEECKVTKIKAAVKLDGNGDLVMAMVRDLKRERKC